jgi:ribonuclease HI
MKKSELVSISIYSDGGCKGNGKPGATAYGSFQCIATDKQGKDTVVRHTRLDHPALRTNNEAEYATLLEAVMYIENIVRTQQLDVPVTIKIDSQVIFEQLTGAYKCKAENLQYYKNTVAAAINTMHAKLELVSGDHMKVVLGH